MKAAVFYGPPGSWPGKPMKIEEMPQPAPGPGEVVLRVAACGMCRTDLDYLKEGMSPPKKPPLVLGHEPSGTVEEVGRGVEGFNKGDKVLVAFSIPCQRCPTCRSGRENLCPSAEIIGASRDGAFAQYVLVPASNLCLLPEGLPLEESAIITDAIATPYHALVNVAQVRPGDVVAIYGASGGLGLASVQIARSLGATVIGIGRKGWKLEKARDLGALHTVSALDMTNVAREVNRLTGGGADISLDASGVPGLIEAACRATRPGGKIVVMGFGLGKFQVAINRINWLEHNIVGSRTYQPLELRRVVSMVQRGMVDIKKIVSHKFPLEEINSAYDMLERGEVLRGIITP